MVAIARALATDPTLVLLDEALEGLAPIVRPRLAKGIQQMKEEGISILMAESNILHVKDVADRIYKVNYPPLTWLSDNSQFLITLPKFTNHLS